VVALCRRREAFWPGVVRVVVDAAKIPGLSDADAAVLRDMHERHVVVRGLGGAGPGVGGN
jgi:hypothetical protein